MINAIREHDKYGMCREDSIEIVKTEKKMYFLPML